jgi:hypothetical protein
MQATARLSALACALLATALASPVAEAKIRPLPRPIQIVAKPGAVPRTSLIAPQSRPVTHAARKPARRRVVARAHRAPHRRTTTRVRRHHAFTPAKSHGGRERPWHVLSLGGRVLPPVPPLVPTPLALVGVGEALPAYDPDWPAWKIAALALLGFSETFVLVRLVRSGRLMAAAELT